MKKILLCCAAGMSTSILVKKMLEEAKNQNEEFKIWAAPVEELETNLKEELSVVLLGPQIKYKLNEVHKVCDEKKVPCDVINMMDYGTMNGKKVLEFAINLMR